MRFLNVPQLERIRGTDEWRLLNNFSVKLNDGRTVTVPKGFVTDKASVPRAVWWLIPRDDKYIVDAALIHDYLYGSQQINRQWITRLQADQIFRGILIYAGMGWMRRSLAYSGVRVGGWKYFNPQAKAIGNPL